MPDTAQDDGYIKDVLTFFYPQNPPRQLNDELRLLAATMLHAAIKASEAMNLVPRPPGGKPGVAWMVLQAVKIFFRAQGRTRIYESVRVTVARNFRSQYELAKMGL